MKLTLVPKARTPRSTISCLYVNDRFECYVLEPPNPIPAGTFDILLLHSARFNRTMPFLQSVPGHTGIEIHWGNTPADTKDCLIVGRTVGTDEVGQSREAFDALFPKFEGTSPLTIEITREAILPSGAPVVQPEGVSMPDPVPTAPPAAPAPSPFEVHPKVALPVFAGSLVAVVLTTLKMRWGIDLSAESNNLIILVMGVIGYYTPGA